MEKTLKYMAILTLCGSSAFSMKFINNTDVTADFSAYERILP